MHMIRDFILIHWIWLGTLYFKKDNDIYFNDLLNLLILNLEYLHVWYDDMKDWLCIISIKSECLIGWLGYSISDM